MGIFNLIKSAFSGTNDDNESQFDQIIDAAYKEMTAKGERYWWSLKANEIQVFTERVLALSDKQKVNFILSAIYHQYKFRSDNAWYNSANKNFVKNSIAGAFMSHLFRMKLVLDDEDISNIASKFGNYPMSGHNTHILYWPVNTFVNQVEKQVKERAVTGKLKDVLQQLAERVKEPAHSHQVKDQVKILEKIDRILYDSANENDLVKPTFFPSENGFALYANEAISAMKEADQQNWFKLMIHAQKATGGKPSKKFLDEARILFKEFGADKFKQQVNDWFLFLVAMKDKTADYEQKYGETVYRYTVTEFLPVTDVDILKGLIWSCVHFYDKTTLFNIAKLADRAFRKIPGKGPGSAAVGNACLYVLANSKGLDGVGHLSRLKIRIKQNSTQVLIEKYLQEAAKAQGVTIHEIEDMAVDDYGLVAGKKQYEFDDFKAVLDITGVGKTTLNWFKPDGSPQKAIPATLKTKHAAKLKKLKETIKQIELALTAQRDRIDRMFKSDRKLSGPKFNEFYFEHGLMRFLTHKIIWTVEKAGKKDAVFFLDNRWVNSSGQEVEVTINDDTTVNLWHPVSASVAEIKSWREFMMRHKIVQPLKQAYREVYLLTDAEINTLTYSNRMAAHILKQHQFNSLAKTRGWKYALMGGFDNGGNQMASMELKEFALTVEFWINEINADDAMNETGIWLYVATDQVRFIDTASRQVIELIEIPAIILSEVLRDVDLFVGVASVGNDPNWRDSGGLPAYRDYWQSYSFGDLTEVAKTRKTILEGLLPRLKIANVATLKDKFLVVKGKLRTYKIHIGSTNILMEPNDQYLCIVPDRGKNEMPDNVFLPFEGDNGLSVILSKAMLLAEDDKITDKTITSQINRK